MTCITDVTNITVSFLAPAPLYAPKARNTSRSAYIMPSPYGTLHQSLGTMVEHLRKYSFTTSNKCLVPLEESIWSCVATMEIVQKAYNFKKKNI